MDCQYTNTGSPYVKNHNQEKALPIMRNIHFLLLLTFIACLSGCSPKAGPDRKIIPDLTGVRVNVKETGVEKKIDELNPDDVVVAVDGIPYTKRMFDEERMLLVAQLSKRGMSPQELMSTVSDMAPLFPGHFANRYLLILDAQRLGSPSKDEVQKAYARNLEGLMKSRKATLEQIENAYPSKNKDMMYRKIAEEIYVRLYTSKNIAPVRVVDSNLVAEVKEAIKRSAAESAATNAQILAELKSLSQKLAGNKEAFAAEANKWSADPLTAKNGGYIGFAEREQIDNKEVATAIFALKKVGDITEPIVEDDSAFIVQLLSVTPPVTNESGRVVQGEQRELARIYRELEGQVLQMSDEELWKDTDRQMHNQGLLNKINDLATNGVFKVVYPYGKNLF